MGLVDHLAEFAVHCEHEVFLVVNLLVYVNLEDVLIQNGFAAIPDETTERSARRSRPRKQNISISNKMLGQKAPIEPIERGVLTVEVLNANDAQTFVRPVGGFECASVHQLAYVA